VLPISYRSSVALKAAGMISALTCRAASIRSQSHTDRVDGDDIAK
jgi:hypothetical protein